MVVQAVAEAQQILDNIEESNQEPLTKEFAEKVMATVQTNLEESIHIQKVAAERSVELTTYFVEHKKYLSGYHANKVSEENLPACQLTRKILTYPGMTVKCQDIARSSRLPAEAIKTHMLKLSNRSRHCELSPPRWRAC